MLAHRFGDRLSVGAVGSTHLQQLPRSILLLPQDFDADRIVVAGIQ